MTELLNWRGSQGIITATLSGPMSLDAANLVRLVSVALYVYGHPEGVAQGANLVAIESADPIDLHYDDGLSVSLVPAEGHGWGDVRNEADILLVGQDMLHGRQVPGAK